MTFVRYSVPSGIGAQKATAHAQRSFIALDRLLAGGPFEAYSRATSTRPGSVLPADVHNLAILSRWPICEQRQIHHDIVPKLRWTPTSERRGVWFPRNNFDRRCYMSGFARRGRHPYI